MSTCATCRRLAKMVRKRDLQITAWKATVARVAEKHNGLVGEVSTARRWVEALQAQVRAAGLEPVGPPPPAAGL